MAVIFVDDYPNVDPTGLVDSRQGIQAAINDAQAQNAVLAFGDRATYRIDQNGYGGEFLVMEHGNYTPVDIAGNNATLRPVTTSDGSGNHAGAPCIKIWPLGTNLTEPSTANLVIDSLNFNMGVNDDCKALEIGDKLGWQDHNTPTGEIRPHKRGSIRDVSVTRDNVGMPIDLHFINTHNLHIESVSLRGQLIVEAFGSGDPAASNGVQGVWGFAGDMVFEACEFGEYPEGSGNAGTHIVASKGGQVRGIHFDHCNFYGSGHKLEVSTQQGDDMSQVGDIWFESCAFDYNHGAQNALQLLAIGDAARMFQIHVKDCYFAGYHSDCINVYAGNGGHIYMLEITGNVMNAIAPHAFPGMGDGCIVVNGAEAVRVDGCTMQDAQCAEAIRLINCDIAHASNNMLYHSAPSSIVNYTGVANFMGNGNQRA